MCEADEKPLVAYLCAALDTLACIFLAGCANGWAVGKERGVLDVGPADGRDERGGRGKVRAELGTDALRVCAAKDARIPRRCQDGDAAEAYLLELCVCASDKAFRVDSERITVVVGGGGAALVELTPVVGNGVDVWNLVVIGMEERNFKS